MKFINIREACPCGMSVMSNVFKKMFTSGETFNQMIGHLVRTKHLIVRTCKEMHS